MDQRESRYVGSEQDSPGSSSSEAAKVLLDAGLATADSLRGYTEEELREMVAMLESDEQEAVDRVREAQRVLIEGGLAAPEAFRGYTESEIRELEDAEGSLPEVFKVFLRLMGHRAGRDFNRLCSREVGDYRRMREAAASILAHEGEAPLPEDAFVFAATATEDFTFFRRFPLERDPRVTYHGPDASEQEYLPLSRFLLSAARNAVEIRRNLEALEKELAARDGRAKSAR